MRAAVVPNRVVIFHEWQTAAARAEFNPNSLTLFDRQIVSRDPRIRESFARCCQGERHCARHMLAILCRELSFPIKALNLSRDLDRRIRNVERLDSAHAAFAALQPRPEG